MAERRGSPRWQINRPILYQEKDKEVDLSNAFLEDFNLKGVKIHLNGPLALRTRLKLVVEISDQMAPIFSEGEVIWQSSIGDKFSTGIRFTLFKPADKQRVLEHFDREIKGNWWRQDLG